MKRKNNFEANEKRNKKVFQSSKFFDFILSAEIQKNLKWVNLIAIRAFQDSIYGIQIGFSDSVSLADLSPVLSLEPPLTFL